MKKRMTKVREKRKEKKEEEETKGKSDERTWGIVSPAHRLGHELRRFPRGPGSALTDDDFECAHWGTYG